MSTGESPRAELTSIDQLDVIVDADAHSMESLDDMVEHMENDVARRAISKSQMPLNEIFTMSLGGPLPHTWYGTESASVTDTQEISSQQAKRKLTEMDDFGIDYGIPGPSLNLQLPTVNNDRMAVALARAYNNWMAESLLDASERILPAMVVAPQVPDRAAEEIDRWAEEVYGIHVPPTGNVPPLGHESYDPIYEAAQDAGLPILLHSGAPATIKSFPIQNAHSQSHAEYHVPLHGFSLMWQFNSMMFSGIPERFPDLQFVFQESGLSWVPWMKFRMDDHYLYEGDVVPHLNRLPSEYIPGRFYWSTQPVGHASNPEHIAWIVKMIGAGSILFSSDLPHPDFDTPEELFGPLQGHLDDREIRGIMGENAIELFDLPI